VFPGLFVKNIYHEMQNKMCNLAIFKMNAYKT